MIISILFKTFNNCKKNNIDVILNQIIKNEDDFLFYIDHMREIFKNRFKNPTAFVKTFGCQQNEADSEKICGFLKDIGFKLSDDPIVSDFIVLNTCAVRHSAQNRIYGHIGELKKLKLINKNIFISIF